jgi:hypothetical protein
MWQILKAEFSYTRDALILAYTIAAIVLVLALTVNGWDIYDYMSNTTVVYFILMGILGIGTINEKRYRYLSTLPVSPQELAIVDGLYVIFVQFGMVLLWMLYLLISRESLTPEVLWAMIANSASILSVITIVGIHYHLGFFGTDKYKRLNWLLLLIFLLTMAGIGYAGKIDGVVRFMWPHYASRHGALASVLLCLALSVLSANLFVRRKSYLA